MVKVKKESSSRVMAHDQGLTAAMEQSRIAAARAASLKSLDAHKNQPWYPGNAGKEETK